MVSAHVLSYQQDSVTVWSGKQVTVYELSGTVLRSTGTTLTQQSKQHLTLQVLHWRNCPDSPVLHCTLFSFSSFSTSSLVDFPGSFPCDSHVVAVHGENLYTVEPNRVQIRTPQVCLPIQYSYQYKCFSVRDEKAWHRSFSTELGLILEQTHMQVVCVIKNLVRHWTIFFPLISLGHCEATADFLQGRGQPCTTQCVWVLPGCGHRHSTHQSIRPLSKRCQSSLHC